MRRRSNAIACIFGLLLCTAGVCAAQAPASVPAVRPDWEKITGTHKTDLTVGVWMHPMFLPDSPIHDPLFEHLKNLEVDYARFVAWHRFPKLAVAELEPPANGKTSWNFTYLDPLMVDFMKAAEGRPVQINWSTIPQWMFKTEQPVPYPADPKQVTQKYGGGTELRDPSLKELRDYFVRFYQWYAQGGFVDQYGKEWKSGHRFKFANWEVLNEPDLEHKLSPELYTRIYDEVVEALQKLDPEMTYCGLSTAFSPPEYFEYFLNPANHKPGIPLDAISYHFYTSPDPDETPEVLDHTTFTQVDAFAKRVQLIEAMRKRLSPATKTFINEVGLTIPSRNTGKKILPPAHFNRSAAMLGHLYLQMAPFGIEMLAPVEINDYPGSEYEELSMTDWKTGQVNAWYWVVKLIHDEIRPGYQTVETKVGADFTVETIIGSIKPYAFNIQGFVSPQGERKLLVVNKRNRPLDLRIAGAKGAQVQYIDQITASAPPAQRKLDSDTLGLGGFAVAVVHLAKTN